MSHEVEQFSNEQNAIALNESQCGDACITALGNWVVQELESARHGYKDWKTFAIRSEKTNVCLAIVGEIDRYHEKEYKSIARVMAAAPKLLEICKKTKTLLNEVAEMNIQPFPIMALQLNRDLIKILATIKQP